MKHTPLFSSLRGSFAQGLNVAQSDRDFFHIVIPPREAIIGLEEFRGSHIIDPETGLDARTISLKEFLKYALYGRSTELECLFCRDEDVIEQSQFGLVLRDNKQKLISGRLINSLMGFYRGQKHRMFRGNAGRFNTELGYDPKMAAHGLRALWQCINLYQSQRLDIYIHDELARKLILDIKQGSVNHIHLSETFSTYEKILEDTMKAYTLPSQPDYKWANDFLMETYHAHV